MKKSDFEKLQQEATKLYSLIKNPPSEKELELEILKAHTETTRIAIILAMQDREIPDDKIIKLTNIFQKKLDQQTVDPQQTPELPESLQSEGKAIDASSTYDEKDLTRHFFSLGEFAHEICFNEKFGYYSQLSDNLGFFTIANNEAQFGFAMSLVAKAMNHWISQGTPEKFAMVQLSGGNGELDLIILNISRIMAEKSGEESVWGRFYQALNFRTIDISSSLSARQSEICERYKGKYDVVHGDATTQESWDKVKQLGCAAHFVFSNELLDMLFPEYYTFVGKKQEEVAKTFVVTKIKNFDDFSKKLLSLLKDDEKLADLLSKISKNKFSTSGFGLPINKDEIVVSKEHYQELMSIMTTNQKLLKDEKLDKHFEHLVVEFPLNLSSDKRKELKERLETENQNYKPIKGQKYFYTHNQRIESLLSLQLPNQEVYHFDYFAKNPNDVSQQGPCILRHHSADEEIETDGSFMHFDENGTIRINHGMPNRYDTTQTVRITNKMNVCGHANFISDEDRKLINEIGAVFGLNTKNFEEQSSQSDLGFFQSAGLSKSVAPRTASNVAKSQNHDGEQEFSSSI